METTSVRSEEMREIKLRPIPLAPAATFKFRNALGVDILVAVEGTTVTIQLA
jgi:hypothetical protein